jgi:hypothetical protein
VCEACSCDGIACGYNNCFESCGDCPAGQLCTETNTCEACTCEGGFTCGFDSAGCNCGTCATGYCDASTHACDPAATALCNNSCHDAGDGYCDDGGLNCDYSICEFGSDCTDCGTRTEADRLPEGTGCGE